MKKIIFLIIFIILSFGENINKQILRKLDKIDNEIKIIKKEIYFTKKEMRIGFEAMDKRFEMMQKVWIIDLKLCNTIWIKNLKF